MPALPEIPAQDFFLAFASAGILLWALLHVARARFFWSGNDALSDEEPYTLFNDMGPQRAPRQLTFLASLFLHLVGVALLPWVEYALPGRLPFDIHRYDLVIVQFKMKPGPLKIPADLRRKEEAPKPEDEPVDYAGLDADHNDPGRGNRVDAPKQKAGGEDQQPKPERVQPERAQLAILTPERPEPAARALNDLSDDPGVAVPLPLEQNIAAPSLNAVLEYATPDVGRVLDPLTPALADLDLDRAPALSVTAGPQGGPAVARIIRAGGPGLLGDGGLRSLLAGWQAGAAGRLGDALREGAFGELFSGGAGYGEGGGFGDETGPGASGFGASGLGVGFGGKSPLPRKLHGIILVSNDGADMDDADGLLTGNPIYTVYLEVPGFRQKWRLQVCVPGSDGAGLEYDGGVLRVLSRKSLDPPYAFQKASPKLDLGELDWEASLGKVVIYATVDEEGDLGDARVVSGVDPAIDNTILASLEEWEFHPAFRDGVPVAVEAVFGIPLR